MDLTFVDAFTDQTFAGNPAAVCFLDRAADDTWMQALARETNMPATAFLRAQGDGFALRWFSTIGELALCGHGTLAAAHALWDSGRLPRGEIARFATRAGALGAAWHDGWVEMDFPAEPARPAEAPPALLRALAMEPLVCSRNRLDYLLELESEAAVRAA